MRQPKLRRRPLNKALIEQLYHVEYSAEQIRLASGAAAAGGALLGLAGLATGAEAATFTVTNLNDSGAGSLRQAILDAEAAPDADTILFQSGLSGTIQLTTGHLQIDYSVNVQGPGAGIITVSGAGVSTRATNGEGTYTGGVFQIGPAVVLYQPELQTRGALPQVTLSGLTITNGSADFGGNISNTSAELTVQDCIVSDGVAYYDGGGIFNSAITHVVSSTVTGNSAAYGDGGGAFSGGYYDSRLTATDSTISESYAYYEGGGISVGNGSLAIATSVISGNTGSTGGGGVYAHIDAVDAIDISGSTFSGNDTNYGDASGGGLAIRHTGTSIRSSTLSGNSAVGDGGGLYLHNHYYAVNLENLTASGNTAADAGGGIALDAENDDTILNFVTITGNTANIGGGLNTYYSGGTTGSPAITNSVIAGNSGAGSDFEGSLDGTTLAFSAIGTENATFTDGGGNLFAVAPMLGALANNGGATQTHLPLAGSPLLDAADPAFAPPPGTDQRGEPRVSGGRADMGAVEVTAAAVPKVPVPATSNPALALLAAAMAAIGLTGLSRRMRGGAALAAVLAAGLVAGSDPALAAKPDHDEVTVGTILSARAANANQHTVEVRLADGSSFVTRRGHLRVIDRRSTTPTAVQSLADVRPDQAVLVRAVRSERGRINSLRVVLFDSLEAARAHRLATQGKHAH